MEPRGRWQRQTSVRSIVTVLIGAVAVCGCTHDQHPAVSIPARGISAIQRRADVACRGAYPNAWVTGYPMTVGAIHALSGSPRPFPDVLRGLPATTAVAWCWRRVGRYSFVAYVVGPHSEIVDVDDQAQAEHPPTGPMLPPGQHFQTDDNK